MRRLTVDLEIDQVREIVRGLDGAPEPVAFSRLHGGSQDVYRIDLRDRSEPVVLKLYTDEPGWRPAKEALVAGWIDRDLGVPTPHWLSLDESRTILPLRFAVMTWLPGRTVRSLMSEPDVEGLYREMGALLRRVHTIPMPAYGYIIADGIWQAKASNLDYMTSAFEGAFRRFRNLGGDEGLGRRIEQAARPRFPLLAHGAGPVLCHDDFQPGNVLAARDASGEARLTGLIDFGNALAGDPFGDLAKALFCSSHEDPRSYAPILEGYGPIDHPEPAQALWLYVLYHRLTMWNWLSGLGDDPAALLHDLGAMAP